MVYQFISLSDLGNKNLYTHSEEIVKPKIYNKVLDEYKSI